jgi:hypothetical protein
VRCQGEIEPNVHRQGGVQLAHWLLELHEGDWKVTQCAVECHRLVVSAPWPVDHRRTLTIFEDNPW